MPDQEAFHIYRRRLPHWRQGGSVYFVTFRLMEGALDLAEVRLIRELILEGHRRFYCLYGAIIMPDHVHVILQPNEEVGLSRIMKGIKGKSARQINSRRNTAGSIWQDECWDRMIRNDEELFEKFQYMFDNPIKKGLCEDTSKYLGWILPE